jgi:hypothetical protein
MLLAWRVSADEPVPLGTEADRVYVGDGFYEPERSAEHGTYRWTQPLAQTALPNWGPGKLHVRVTGVGVSPGEALLKVEGTPVATAAIQPGQPWTLEAWADTSARSPTLTIESPAFSAAGDTRTLGLLVKSIEVYAPEARLRSWLTLALLGASGALLCLFLMLRVGLPWIAAIAGASVPATYGLLAVYRDPWILVASIVEVPALAAMLYLARRAPASSGSSGTYRSRQAVWAVVALTAALFLLYLGYMNAFDSDRMYQVAAGIAEYGRPTRYPGLDTWTKYGFGQPLIAVPFYLLGKLGVLLGGVYEPVTRLAVSFTNLAVTALTCWLLYIAARRFASVGVSLAVAATYLLTTPALNYARTFFSEPAGGLLLLAALLLIIPRTPGETPRASRILLAGACLGAMILFKPAFAVYIPGPGLAVLWLLYTRGRTTGSTLRAMYNALRGGLLFAVGPAVALAIQLVYNYVRYEPLPDAIFRNGYEREPGFSTPLLEGLGGLLFSPGKSIFLYAPVLLLMPVGLWLMYRRGGPGRLTAVLITAEVVVGFAANAMWWAWTGNFAWGPRLIMPVLPLMVWPLAALATAESRQQAIHEARLRVSYSTLRVGLWVVLAVLGAVVSIPGAMVDFQVYYRNYGLQLAGDPGESLTIYDPANSPLLVEPGYLLDGLTAAIHRPSLSDAGMPPAYDVIVPALLAIIALAALWLACDTRSVIQRK